MPLAASRAVLVCSLLQQEEKVKGQTAQRKTAPVHQTPPKICLHTRRSVSAQQSRSEDSERKQNTTHFSKTREKTEVKRGEEHDQNLSDTRPQKSAWRRRTRGRQQTTGIRQSLSIRTRDPRDTGYRASPSCLQVT